MLAFQFSCQQQRIAAESSQSQRIEGPANRRSVSLKKLKGPLSVHERPQADSSTYTNSNKALLTQGILTEEHLRQLGGICSLVVESGK